MFIALTIVGGREWKRQGVIQGLAMNLSEKPFPCGMTLHPTNNSIIMNANCGKLQFYDIHSGHQNYQVILFYTNF